MYIDLDSLAVQIEEKIDDRLTNESNTRSYIFPDGDFNKSGKPFSRNTLVVSLANQIWTAPTNPAALSRGMSLAQETNIDLSFYLFAASLRGPKGIGNQYRIIIEELAALELKQGERKLGPLYPTSFSYRDLSENCIWSYELLMSTNFLDGGKRPAYNMPIVHG